MNKYTTISFPSIGLEIDPGRSLQITENFAIHYYGIIIAVGLLLAVFYGLKRSKQFGLKQDDILDGVLGIVPFAVICARAYYCAFSWSDYAENPISVLYIWEGGLAIYGGVIGAALGVIVFCAIKKIKIGAVLDIVSLGFLIGQSIGRWGNFFNREAFGEATDSFFRMGLLNSYNNTVEYYHPTFLYESVWNLVGFIALHFLSKKRKYDGQIALGYMAWYGLGRALIEGLRTDILYLGNFRVSQLLAALSFVVAVGVLLWQSFRSHDPQKLFVNQVAAREAAMLAEQEQPESTETAEEETLVPEETEEETSAQEGPETNEE